MGLITRVGMRRFRGQDRQHDLSKPLVLLKGPVGAGKTSVMLAITMLAGLPTALGSKGLGLLAPEGIWMIDMDVKGVRYQWKFDAQLGSVFMVGAPGREAPVKQDRFNINLKRDLDLEPHHVDLSAFADLSGAKRAALFAAILSGDPVTLDEAVAAGSGMTMDALAKKVAGSDASVATFPNVPSGLPGPLCDAVKDWHTKLKATERDARRDAAAATRDEGAAPADPESLRSRLSDIDQKMGEVNASVSHIENATRAYKAAGKTVQDQEKIEAMVQQRLDAARRTADTIPALEAEVKALELSVANSKPIDMSTLTFLKAEVAGIVDAGRAAPAGVDSTTWLDGWKSAHNDLLVHFSTLGIREEQRAKAPSQRALEEKRKTLALSKTNVENISKFEEELKQASDRLVELRRTHQDMTIPGDVTILQTQKEGLEKDRREITGSIASAEQAKAALARVEAAKLKAVELDLQVKIGDAILEAVNSYRDAQTSTRIQQVTQPMSTLLSELFGRVVNVEFRIAGEGRSQQVDILVKLKDSAVRFQDLSGGESMLVAAAFLSTLQSIKGTPGKMLLLEGDALDAPSMAAFIEKAPALGMDLLMVATNKEVAAGEAWQTILV